MQRQAELEGREKSDVLLIRVEQQRVTDGKVLVCDGKSDDMHGMWYCSTRVGGKRLKREGEREREATAAAAAAEAGCLGWIMDRRLELRMN